MDIKTRDFGVVEVNEEDIVHFVEPILGFEDYRDFCILFDDEIGDEIAWLQSVQDESICFLLASSSALKSDYSPEINVKILEKIGGDYEIWFVLVAAGDFVNSTINLKSPIIYSPQTSKAAQTILDGKYPIRYALFTGKEL